MQSEQRPWDDRIRTLAALNKEARPIRHALMDQYEFAATQVMAPATSATVPEPAQQQLSQQLRSQLGEQIDGIYRL